MTSWSRRLSATVVVAVGCLLCRAETLAHERKTLLMTVVIRQQDVISAQALQEAMAVVSRIYRQAGVDHVIVSMVGLDEESLARYGRVIQRCR